eukprot:TRINITY_DN40100_c0_g1_i1.p1 TRINITY_DN40100_c0_g1~~TRINITY_DN40100_c0_g1_i1.p1  ORF type:complete len:282 (-),score=64.60 TRINITY_DN40100_c0_g1_i1:9-854(-)
MCIRDRFVAARTTERAANSPNLERWVREHGRFPNTMVDRITPGFSQKDVELLASRYGLEDRVPVSAEPFIQWVIQDDFVDGDRPAWDKAGALFSSNVAPYEMMKLRLLNAGHSVLAYSALLTGHDVVHDAMANQTVAKLVRAYMEEITPAVPEVPGIDLSSYKVTLAERFANPNIADEVLRLAEDGSLKMAGFVGPAVTDMLAPNRESVRPVLPASGLAGACWMRCLGTAELLSLIHISEPTRLLSISYAVFCLKKKKNIKSKVVHYEEERQNYKGSNNKS